MSILDVLKVKVKPQFSGKTKGSDIELNKGE